MKVMYMEGRVDRKNFPTNSKKRKKVIKYFVEVNKNEVNRNRSQKNKRKRLAASKIQCLILIAKLVIIIFESADLHFLNFY